MNPGIEHIFEPKPFRRFIFICGLTAMAATLACGGDDEEPMMMMMMPMPSVTSSVAFTVQEPCNSVVPEPTDLFYGADGQNEGVECDLPSDPLDAAVARVLRDQRIGFNPEIRLPIVGSLDATTITSTVMFGFGGGSGSGLPPLALVELTGTATAVSGWRAIPFTAQAGSDAIIMRPSRALLPNRLHVVIATRALRDTEMPSQSLAPSAAVNALLGTQRISAGAAPGLSDSGAARLERMRNSLREILEVLPRATPPILKSDVVSIHSFTTRENPADFLPGIIQRYRAATNARTYRYEVTIEEMGIAPATIYGSNVPAAAYPNVGSFVRGSVQVPRMLTDGLRLRPRWDTEAETINVPFLLSVPRMGGTSYPVAVHVVGFGRSRLDARALANTMGGAVRGSVLAIELRCHGRRSPGTDGVCTENRTAADEMALADTMSNNGNPEIVGPDGIPDASGIGYFPGDPRQLRDTQVASIIEIMHVVASLRDQTAWNAVNIPIDRRAVHLIAQGYTALPAAAAAALTENALRPRTIQFAAGGADLAELILRGAREQVAAFNDTLPGTIGGAQAPTLLMRVSDYLAPVQLPSFQSALVARYTVGGTPQGFLLPHPDVGQQGVNQYVSPQARSALRMGLGLPPDRVSQHRARCDNYFVFTCQLGNNPVILEQARDQMSGFINSNGVTIPQPG